MLINFANENLTKRIICDKPCTDSNDVSNLISVDPVKRTRGFLVENFVKLPVIISIEFICSITIKEITVNCQVGAQKSSSIEVYTRQNGKNEKVIVARKEFKENENTVHFVLHDGKRNKPGCVTFRLSKYMCNISEIYLKILRTQGSTLAAIGKVEILGRPSRQEDQKMVKEVNDIWTKINTIPVKNVEQTSTSLKKTVFRYCREIKVPEVEVPEEFIDPITCEILVIPMILPSGKVVDASTLERFNSAEEDFGRPPSDPFTGRIFTESNHPVVATALKARLDKFLLDYSHIPSLKTVPRTVGRASSSTHPTIPAYSVQPQKAHLPSTSKQSIKNVNELLESCLSGLPSFLEKPKDPFPKSECLNCNSQSLLFKLKCNDFLCRNCLVSFKNKNIKSCAKCKSLIDYKNAERFHSA